MIQPISRVNYNYYKNQKTNSINEYQSYPFNNDYQLSGFKAGQAILNRNNISFKNLAAPIEVTDKYNKSIQGKDHLDLPNIHIYEYPDTNLQVFVDSAKQKEDDKNNIIMSLNIIDTPDENDSYVKKELAGSMICRLVFDKDFIGSRIDYDNFFGVNYVSKFDDFAKIKEINKMVTSPEFDPKVFETAKKDLIEDLTNRKPRNQKLLQETIKEIQNVSLNEIKEYYLNKLKNSEARLIVSVDETNFNKNKNQLFNAFNQSINGKFKPKSQDYSKKTEKLNTEQIIYRNKYDSNDFLEMHYLMPMDNLKNRKIAEYISLLELEYRESYLNDKESFPLTIKLSSDIEDYLNNVPHLPSMRFRVMPQSVDKMKTEKDAIDVCKNILWMIKNEPLFGNTLERIKDIDKQYIGANVQNGLMFYRNFIIKESYYDIFKIYETIDSITINDVIDAIDKYILNQEPIIYINENNNPYNRKGN